MQAIALESDDEAGQRGHRIADLGPFELLDVSPTRDEAGRTLTLGIVNRDHDASVTTTVELGNGASISSAVGYEVNGADPTVRTSFARPSAGPVRQPGADAAGPLGDRRPAGALSSSSHGSGHPIAWNRHNTVARIRVA